MMKIFRINSLIILILATCIFGNEKLFAQINNFEKVSVGISVSPIADNSIGPFQSLDGGGSFESSKYFGTELSVNVPIKGIISFESGLGLSKRRVTYTGDFFPNREIFKETESLSILEVPILTSVHIGNYFYANLGPTVHFDLSKKVGYRNKQNGIGAKLGIGGNWNISSLISVRLEPELKLYSLMPFETKKYYDRIIHSGIKIGARFVLN